MNLLHGIKVLQPVSRAITDSTQPYQQLSSTASTVRFDSPTAPGLVLKPTMADQLKTRLCGTNRKFAKLKESGSHRTWSSILCDKTRVDCGTSPVTDLPYSPPVFTQDKKPRPERREKLDISNARHAEALLALQAQATAGLFGATTRSSAASDSASVSVSESGSGSMRNAVDLIASLFPDITDQQFCRFQRTLHTLDLPRRSDRTPLAYALAAAAGGDVMLAEKILSRLSQGLVLNDLSNQKLNSGGDALARRAWEVARLLSQDQAGYAILKSIHPAHADFGRAARVVLQTGAFDAPGESTCLAARAHEAAQRMLKPGANLAASDKAAIFAWEQGFRTDGPGSPLFAAQQQLARFAKKTIPRAQASRARTLIARLAGKKKSPLAALRQGLHGADRSSLISEQETVRSALKITLNGLLENMLADPGAILQESDPAAALVTLATLRFWSSHPTAYPGQRIAKSDHGELARNMSDIINTIPVADRRCYFRQFDAITDAAKMFHLQPEAALEGSPTIRRLTRQPLTLKRLAAWGKLRQIPEEASFWQHLEALRRTLKPQNIRQSRFRRQGFRFFKKHQTPTRETLGTLIERMESGSRLRLIDGTRRGISTRGLSFNVGRILNLSGLPLGPRLNLGHERRRRALVEISHSSIGGEILIGSERCRRTTIGAGLMVGYDFSVGPPQARLGVSFDGEKSIRKNQFSGIALRVAQRQKADGSIDHERRKQGMHNIMDFMFSQRKTLTRTQHDAEHLFEHLFERFAATFFNDADISLSWNDAQSQSTTYGASAVASALLKIDGTPLNFGPGVGLTTEHTRSKATDAGNATGRMQSIFHRQGKSTDVALTAGLKGKISQDAPGKASASLGIGLLNTNLVSLTIPVYIKGSTGKATLIRENGRLIATTSVLDLEFTQVDHYISGLNADRHRWISHLAKKYAGKQDAYEMAEKQFDQFLDTARHHARRNQRFVQRQHLRKEIADQIDRHCVSATLIRDNQHLPSEERDRLCAAREEACARLVALPGSWEPKELKIIENSSSYTRLGLSAGLQVATESSAEGEHQLSNLRV